MRGVVLAVHGGAGAVTREKLSEEEAAEARRGLETALSAGRAVLAAGGPALDAVVEAVAVLENHPAFNAGLGSVLTSTGRVEMDASVMDGRTREAGSVAAVRDLAHPIRVARLVMEKSPHVLLAGPEVETFAREHGAEIANAGSLVVPERFAQLRRARARARVSLDHDEGKGTVGAVARDAEGHLAAATSTGGMTNQLPGRVGDSPVPGAGTWADDATCAVSGSGHGEAFLCSAFAHEVDARMRLGGASLAEACAQALARVAALGSNGGCVAVDREGDVALPFTTVGMYRGHFRSDEPAEIALFGPE